MRRTLGWSAAAAACALLASSALPAPTSEAAASLGHVSAHDRVLRPGCHRYPYRYVVRPPTGDWQLTTWLYDARGRRRGYDYFLAGADPTRNRPDFVLCRPDAAPGRYTIKARLRWYDDPVLPTMPPTRHHQWLPPAHLRLRRP